MTAIIWCCYLLCCMNNSVLDVNIHRPVLSFCPQHFFFIWIISSVVLKIKSCFLLLLTKINDAVHSQNALIVHCHFLFMKLAAKQGRGFYGTISSPLTLQDVLWISITSHQAASQLTTRTAKQQLRGTRKWQVNKALVCVCSRIVYWQDGCCRLMFFYLVST